MKKINLSIQINASLEKVWEALLGKNSYPIWTEAFSADSNVVGTWEKGSKLYFTSPNEEGGQDGMVSEVADLRVNEWVSILHRGFLKNGVEDFDSPEVKSWTPAYENYTLKPMNGGTEFTVDMDSADDYYEMFMQMWPEALERLKELSETGTCKTVAVSVWVKAPLEVVWDAFTNPKHITQWCFASDDWEAPFAENDLRVGGSFKTRMQAKDGSFGFDFGGTYTSLKEKESYEYEMEDGRKVTLNFTAGPTATIVREIFDAESENPREMQKSGWQSILNHFKKYVESL